MSKLIGVALLVCAAESVAVAQCPNCSHSLPCPSPSDNYLVDCSQEFNQVVNDLAFLGTLKDNLAFVGLAACLASLGERGRIRLCEDLGNDFMRTTADCEDRSTTPSKKLWCATSDPPGNCVCIDRGDMSITIFGCRPIAANGDPVASAAIMAAALAHETCHAKTGVYCQVGGGPFSPICDYLANEVACATLELQILQCVATAYPTNAPLALRIALIQGFIAAQQAEMVANGC